MRFLLNAFSLLAGLLAAIYALAFIILDPGGLWPASVTMCLCILQVFNPVIALRSEIAGMLFGVANACLTFVLMTWLLGRDAGLYLFILQAPLVVLLFLGSFRPALLVASVAVSLGSILFAVLAFPTPARFIEIAPLTQDVLNASAIAGSMAFITGTGFLSQRRVELAEEALEAEYARSERLVYEMLPERIAALLKADPNRTIAEDVPDATILFADLAGFTEMTERRPPAAVVEMLGEIFAAFDGLIDAFDLEKIKTLGDGYLIAGGVAYPRSDHAEAAAELALALVERCAVLAERSGEPVQVRIGLHSGPLVAGVIARRRPVYDVWGSTVNLAARLEAAGAPGRILVASPTVERLSHRFVFEKRGRVMLKGLGSTDTWWLQRKID